MMIMIAFCETGEVIPVCGLIPLACGLCCSLWRRLHRCTGSLSSSNPNDYITFDGH